MERPASNFASYVYKMQRKVTHINGRGSFGGFMDLRFASSWRYTYFSGPTSRAYQEHFGAVLNCKQNNGYNYSLVGLGGPKKSLEWE